MITIFNVLRILHPDFHNGHFGVHLHYQWKEVSTFVVRFLDGSHSDWSYVISQTNINLYFLWWGGMRNIFKSICWPCCIFWELSLSLSLSLIAGVILGVYFCVVLCKFCILALPQKYSRQRFFSHSLCPGDRLFFFFFDSGETFMSGSPILGYYTVGVLLESSRQNTCIMKSNSYFFL